METRHSPIPWTMGGQPKNGAGSDWREMLAPGKFRPMYIGEALKDDAQLMIAAPELLEACNALLRHYAPAALEQGDWAFSGNSQTDAIIRLARAAISKATGQPVESLA